MSKEDTQLSESMNVKELQSHFGVSRQTVYRYFNEGLEYFWRGGRRASRAAIERFEQERTERMRQKKTH
jgi:transposase